MKDSDSEDGVRRKVEEEGMAKAQDEKRSAAQDRLCVDDGYEMAPE